MEVEPNRLTPDKLAADVMGMSYNLFLCSYTYRLLLHSVIPMHADELRVEMLGNAVMHNACSSIYG